MHNSPLEIFDRVLNLPRVLNIPLFWICQGSAYASGSEYARVLNISGFWISWGYTGLSMPQYFLGMPFKLFNWLGTKVISKNVILPLRKALWTSLKLSQKVDNCYAIVKNIFRATGFLTCFAHFSLQYNFFMLIRGLDPSCGMLKTLEIYRNLGDKKLSVEHTLSKKNNNDWNLTDFSYRVRISKTKSIRKNFWV